MAPWLPKPLQDHHYFTQVLAHRDKQQQLGPVYISTPPWPVSSPYLSLAFQSHSTTKPIRRLIARLERITAQAVRHHIAAACFATLLLAQLAA